MKKIYQTDPWLEPYAKAIEARHERILAEKRKLAGDGPLGDAANNHLYYGLHHSKDGWVIREWAPNASRIYLIGDFNNWKRTPDYALSESCSSATVASTNSGSSGPAAEENAYPRTQPAWYKTRRPKCSAPRSGIPSLMSGSTALPASARILSSTNAT